MARIGRSWSLKICTVSACFTTLVLYLNWNSGRLSFKPKPIFESIMLQTLRQSELPAPSVFLETHAGLGNQLFQYACAYALARNFSFPLYVRVLDEEAAKSRRFGVGDRSFVLDQFKIPFPPALSVTSSWKVSSLTDLVEQDLLSQKVKTLPNLDQRRLALSPNDFFQSETYFLTYRDELRPLLEVKEEALSKKYKEMSDNIRQSNCPICMHIRRGDFNAYRRLPVSYFREALGKLDEALRKRNVQECVNSTELRKFYLFSDDPFSSLEKEFGVEFFRDLQPYRMVSGRGLNSVEEFKLMSECDHNIIPASSYAWWAAYLNRNKKKVVVAGLYHPKVFDQAEQEWMYRHLYYPADWIVIDPWRNNSNTKASESLNTGIILGTTA